MILHLAYVDPTSGSLVLQFVLGGFVGGAYLFRNWIGRITRSIKRPGVTNDNKPSEIKSDL